MLSGYTQEEKLILEQASEVSDQLNIHAYAVGGFVRDKLLERITQDIDIVCLGDSELFAKKLSQRLNQNENVNHFKNFGVAQFKYASIEIEIVTARKESYDYHSRKPSVAYGTMNDDFLRRDFTINAMAMDLNKPSFGTIIDPFNGRHDLAKKIIRTPLDPDITFADDPLRILRAIRFASQLHFSIDETTWAGMLRQKERITILSKERIHEEMNKILLSEKPSVGLYLLDNALLWQYIIPEIPKLKRVDYQDGMGHKDNFHHTLQVVDNVSVRSDDLWLRWAALLHDIAKPNTKKFEEGKGWSFHGHEVVGARMVKSIFRNLKLPMNDKMQFVAKMVFLHLRPIALTHEEVTDSAIRRLLFEAAEDIDSLMILCESDITSKRADKVMQYMKNFNFVRERMNEVQEKDKLRKFKLAIDGIDIMQALQLPPCKQVGDIKQKILDAVLDGVIPNTKQDTYDYLIKNYTQEEV